MRLEDVIAVLINQQVKAVWFYHAEDSTGSQIFQLLNRFGDELAWRWVTDRSGRWRMRPSLLPVHPAVPANATEFVLSSGGLQRLAQVIAAASTGQIRPG